MNKIPLYDFLSLIVPGALLTLLLKIFTADLGFQWDMAEINDFYKTILFLVSALLIGLVVNILSRSLRKFYRKIGIYTSIYKIYKEQTTKTVLEEYYRKRLDLGKSNYKNHGKIEKFWNEMYFELEATDKIQIPKKYHGLYFLSRNLITVGLMILPVIVFMICYMSPAYTYIALLVVILLTMMVSGIAARYCRNMMVNRMFWTYYSLNKNK